MTKFVVNFTDCINIYPVTINSPYDLQIKQTNLTHKFLFTDRQN